ncbi:hypothetical protein KJ780_03450 [Candidatus Micrarchaeota archaeon]|nr:hypothetical protein [Candidatus Micrarchaeota archaeon]
MAQKTKAAQATLSQEEIVKQIGENIRDLRAKMTLAQMYDPTVNLKSANEFMAEYEKLMRENPAKAIDYAGNNLQKHLDSMQKTIAGLKKTLETTFGSSVKKFQQHLNSESFAKMDKHAFQREMNKLGVSDDLIEDMLRERKQGGISLKSSERMFAGVLEQSAKEGKWLGILKSSGIAEAELTQSAMHGLGTGKISFEAWTARMRQKAMAGLSEKLNPNTVEQLKKLGYTFSEGQEMFRKILADPEACDRIVISMVRGDEEGIRSLLAKELKKAIPGIQDEELKLLSKAMRDVEVRFAAAERVRSMPASQLPEELKSLKTPPGKFMSSLAALSVVYLYYEVRGFGNTFDYVVAGTLAGSTYGLIRAGDASKATNALKQASMWVLEGTLLKIPGVKNVPAWLGENIPKLKAVPAWLGRRHPAAKAGLAGAVVGASLEIVPRIVKSGAEAAKHQVNASGIVLTYINGLEKAKRDKDFEKKYPELVKVAKQLGTISAYVEDMFKIEDLSASAFLKGIGRKISQDQLSSLLTGQLVAEPKQRKALLEAFKLDIAFSEFSTKHPKAAAFAMRKENQDLKGFIVQFPGIFSIALENQNALPGRNLRKFLLDAKANLDDFEMWIKAQKLAPNVQTELLVAAGKKKAAEVEQVLRERTINVDEPEPAARTRSGLPASPQIRFAEDYPNLMRQLSSYKETDTPIPVKGSPKNVDQFITQLLFYPDPGAKRVYIERNVTDENYKGVLLNAIDLDIEALKKKSQ